MNEVHLEDRDPSPLESLLYSSQFLGTTSMGIMLHGCDGAVLDCNGAASELLGSSRDQLVGRVMPDTKWGAVREDGSPFPSDERPTMFTLRTGEPCFDVIVGVDNPGMARRWLSVNTCSVILSGGATSVISSFVDATSRIQKDHLLKLLIAVNRVVVFASDAADSLQQLCATLVDEGGYSLAWIGVVSVDLEDGIDIACAAGVTDYLYEGMVSSSGSKPSGLGPVGTAMRTGVTQVTNDMAKNSLFEPWRDRAAEFGLGSCVALPFAAGDQKAVLAVYGWHIVAFDEMTVRGLEAIVNEVEFGIAHHHSLQRTETALEETAVAIDARRTAERTRAEAEQRFRLAFEDNMAPMVFIDLGDQIIAANDSFCQMIGRTREDILGRDSKSFTHPEDVGISEAAHRRLTSGEVGQSRYVKRYIHMDGRVIVVEVMKSTARDDAGKILYFVASQRDITENVQRFRMLRLLTEVNKLAILTSDEADLLEHMCETLVDTGEYALAWFGVTAEDGAGGIEILCAAGDTGYLDDDVNRWWSQPGAGDGPVGVALRTGVTQVANDRATYPRFGEWGKRWDQFGFAASVNIPITVGGRLAILVVYAKEKLAFDEVTVEGLTEIATEFGFGVAHVRSVQRTKTALEETTVAVTALKVIEHALTESEERFRLAFEKNMAPMVFSDLEDKVIAVNDAFCEMVGFTREELFSQDSKQFTFPEDVGITEETLARLTSGEDDQVRYVKRYLRKDGRVLVSEVSRSVARDVAGNILYFVASERDVTEERALTAQLFHQALHDPLTGLANRVLFEDRLSQAHARVVRQGGFGAVLLLDLDDFKGVNDTHGHLIGDQLLAGIARRFELVTRSSDTLCRFGGDEFLYLAEGLTSPGEAQEVAKRLLDVLAEPFSFGGVHLDQHASVGVVVWDATSADSSEFVQEADVALYEAKRQRRGGYLVFTPGMYQHAVNRFALIQELRTALQTGEISMHYQPIVDLKTSGVVGFEALMRWQHPERGWIPPNVFIPLAEQSELILELGSFALREALAAASSWEQAGEGASLPYVSVNLSAHQFRDPDLVPMIERMLVTSGLARERLILEITESVALLDVVETTSVMEQLNRLGIGVALDDFGTGYSSLSHLVLLNPRIIKIDQSFVGPAQVNIGSDSLLETIISLGNKLQMTMLAEGIETQGQLDRLRFLNCELGQGYLFSPAVPAPEAAAMVGRCFAQ
jgi:diguanylate cyclase (GGDEF)-like protein/PAS domain S-box-containing protein